MGFFATNIDGIAIKPAWNNGAAYGYFNSSGIMPAFEREGVPTEEGFGRILQLHTSDSNSIKLKIR